MSLRSKLKALQETNKRFALIHWPEEGTVTVVQDSKVDPYPPEKGDDCLVRAGSKKYRGRVMDVGTEIEMKKKADQFDEKMSEGLKEEDKPPAKAQQKAKRSRESHGDKDAKRRKCEGRSQAKKPRSSGKENKQPASEGRKGKIICVELHNANPSAADKTQGRPLPSNPPPLVGSTPMPPPPVGSTPIPPNPPPPVGSTPIPPPPVGSTPNPPPPVGSTPIPPPPVGNTPIPPPPAGSIPNPMPPPPVDSTPISMPPPSIGSIPISPRSNHSFVSLTPSPEKTYLEDSDPLLLEMEVTDLTQRVMELEQSTAEVTMLRETQTRILATQTQILKRLAVIEKAVRVRSKQQSHGVLSAPSTPAPQLPAPNTPSRHFSFPLAPPPSPTPQDDTAPMPRQLLAPIASSPQQPDPNTASQQQLAPIASSPQQPAPNTTSQQQLAPIASSPQQPAPNTTSHEQPTPLAPPPSPTPQDDDTSPMPLPYKGSSARTLPSSAIDTTKLIPSHVVLSTYPKLQCESKIGTLAVKIATKSIFGEDVMSQCTVAGTREYPALPAAELNMLKTAIFRLCPRYWKSPPEFEGVWKVCTESVGQACKRLRCKKKAP